MSDLAPVATEPLGVVELRRYTLHPGRRDELIELFEREFVDSQEAIGIRLLGLFRDLDHPDVFTWIRGFSDMPGRRRALEAFYDGPIWALHRDAANATMIDSDDVHLLRPVAGVADGISALPARDGVPRRYTVATVYLDDLDDLDDRRELIRQLRVPGWTQVMALETMPAANDFPRLPVHVRDVAVALLGADTPEASEIEPSDVTVRWRGRTRTTTLRRLGPTAQSRLR